MTRANDKSDLTGGNPEGLPDVSRRRWLQRHSTVAAALGLGGIGGLGSLLSSATAAGDDYKALVCLFDYGGNDGLNMVVPTDTTRHAQYAAVRKTLTLPRANLVPLTGTTYGLHPSMTALSAAWNEGALTAVHNVGPLNQPLTKAQYLAAPNGDPSVPDSLFSHSDQQLQWEASSARSSERTGWGGRASQVLATTNPVISFGGNTQFGNTDIVSPWVLPGPGSSFGASGFSTYAPVAARRAALDRVMGERQKGPMGEAYARVMRDSFDVETRLSTLFSFNPNPAADPTGITNAFLPLIANGRLTTDTARQLYQVARFIANRSVVRGNRQVFFVQMGGFDTHSDQLGQHADLMKEKADGMAAFWNALKAIGMGSNVTLFTQSDFGRTFAPNDTAGTDHAWGNEHLVMGGAVAGGATYGRYPVLQIRGPDDVGQQNWENEGRWLPSTSVDQYAATLLRWWGMNEGQLDMALPNLRNFGSARSAGFMRV